MRKRLEHIPKFFAALFEVISRLSIGKNPPYTTSQHYAKNDNHNLIIHTLR